MVLSNLDKTVRLEPQVHHFRGDDKILIDPLDMIYCDFNLKKMKE